MNGVYRRTRWRKEACTEATSERSSFETGKDRDKLDVEKEGNMLLAAIMAAGAVIVAPAVLPNHGEGARRGLEEQIDAWNRGDLEAALRTYWNSPDLVWVSKRGVERGFKDFAEAMRKDFGSAPAEMGTYAAEILHAQDLTPDTALVVYRWSISKGDQKLMGAVSTQVWRRIDGSWRAVLEHAS